MPRTQLNLTIKPEVLAVWKEAHAASYTNHRLTFPQWLVGILTNAIAAKETPK